MNYLERRQEILESLCATRHLRMDALAERYGVSVRTISNDILELSLAYPIYTRTGKYGGVYIADDFQLGKQYLNTEQEMVLLKILPTLQGEDRAQVESILHKFGRPRFAG